VHFVNTRRERGVLLTFGTYTVRNVNAAAQNLSVLTKCTLTAADFAASPTQRS
jgi:hypothetical protein